MRKTCCAAVLAAALVFQCGSGIAYAQFVDGVEEFNGTSFDPNTWVRYGFGQGDATVSNGYLNLTGQNRLATTSLTVGVGDTVSARAMLTAAYVDGTVVMLGLTSMPTKPPSGAQIELLLIHTIQGASEFFIQSGNTGSTPYVLSDNIAVWYRLRLVRTSMSDFTLGLFTDAGAPIFSYNRSYSDLPDRAAVFVGLGPTARFDWVSVPEPGAMGCLGLVCILGRRRRRGLTSDR